MAPIPKRKLDMPSAPIEDASEKRHRNMFAMQQEKERNARQMPAPKSRRVSSNLKQEDMSNVSMRFTFTALPENSKSQKERFRRHQFIRKTSKPKTSSPLADAPSSGLNQSFENLSFNKECEGSDEDSDDETVKNPESFYEDRLLSLESMEPAPVTYPEFRRAAPPRFNVPVNRAASVATRGGMVSVHDPFIDAKPGPRTRSQSRKQALPVQEPTTLLKQSFTNQKSPTLHKNRKQRQGFGLSYTDSRLYSITSDTHFPDTYDEDEPDASTEVAPTPLQSFQKRQLPVNTTFSFISFDEDVLVVREIGSFHTARPQRRFPCTSATRENTIRIKSLAQGLIKFEESMEIYDRLVMRLERMIKNGQAEAKKSAEKKPPTAFDCAYKLREFLTRNEGGRIETGEDEMVVKHESEWAGWMVEATRCGVMHVKGVGCQCRADWEE